MKDFAKKYFEENNMKRLKCCICGCDFYDRTGNNPDPIIEDEDSVCCPACNQLFVIPKRMELVKEFEDDDDFEDDEFEDDEFSGEDWDIVTIPVEIVDDHILPAIEAALSATVDNEDLNKSLLNAKHWLTYVLEYKTYTQS